MDQTWADLDVQKVPNGSQIGPKMEPKRPREALGGPKGPPRCPKETKMTPEGTKMDPEWTPMAHIPESGLAGFPKGLQYHYNTIITMLPLILITIIPNASITNPFLRLLKWGEGVSINLILLGGKKH